MARSLTTGAEPFAFCGIGVRRRSDRRFFTSCGQDISADENSVFRLASVSKIVTAAVFEHVARPAGLQRPYDFDVSPILDLDVRSPNDPQTPVTLGMLMTHTSGLTDANGYIFDRSLHEDWSPNKVFGPHKPGTFFQYCNLGYILLAAAAERLSGKRFDVLVQEVLTLRGLRGGFNWAGTSAPERGVSFPTFRRDGEHFVPMIDHPPQPFVPGADYRLGEDTGKFSPQGGLRLSLRAMLTLATGLGDDERSPMWRSTDGPGDYIDGLMQDYGAGTQILPSPPFYPRPLVGHFGNAYGFKGGVWWDAEAQFAFAYALNGAAVGDESDALCAAEIAIFDAVSGLYAA